MSPTRNTRYGRFSDPQTRGQLLWTALVVGALAWMALDQASGRRDLAARMEAPAPADLLRPAGPSESLQPVRLPANVR